MSPYVWNLRVPIKSSIGWWTSQIRRWSHFGLRVDCDACILIIKTVCKPIAWRPLFFWKTFLRRSWTQFTSWKLCIADIDVSWSKKSASRAFFGLSSLIMDLPCFSVTSPHKLIKPWQKLSNLRADAELSVSDHRSSSLVWVQSEAYIGSKKGMLSGVLQTCSATWSIRSGFADTQEDLQILDCGSRCEDFYRLSSCTFLCFTDTWVRKPCFE